MGRLSDKMGGRRARLSALAMIPLLPAFLGLIFSGSLLLSPRDLNVPGLFVEKLSAGTNAVAQFVWSQIPEPARLDLSHAPAGSPAGQFLLANDLNAVLQGETFYDPARFAGVKLEQRTQALLTEKLNPSKLIYRNRSPPPSSLFYRNLIVTVNGFHKRNRTVPAAVLTCFIE